MPPQPERPQLPATAPGLRRKAAFGILTALLGIVLLEGLLRLFGGELPPEAPPIEFLGQDPSERLRYVFDRRRFWKIRPHSAFFQTDELINERGFRSAPIAPVKPAGTTRILCIGDSTTFGFGVEREESYGSRLARWLNAGGNGTFEVINAGIPAYTSHQSLEVLREFRTDAIDWVFCYIGAWNDYVPAVGVDDARAADILEKAGEKRPSHLVIIQKIARWLRGISNSGSTQPGASRQREYARGWSLAGLRPDGPRVPPVRFEENLQQIVAECRAMGARPMFMIPAAPAATILKYKDSDDYAERVARVAARASVPMVDVRARLKSDTAGDEALFMDFIHPSAAGHVRIARDLAEACIQLGIIQNPRFDPADLLRSPLLLPGSGFSSLLNERTPAAAMRIHSEARHPAWTLVERGEVRRIDNIIIPPAASFSAGFLFWCGPPLQENFEAAPPAGPDVQSRVELHIKIVGAHKDGSPETLFEATRPVDVTAPPGWSPVRRMRFDLAGLAWKNVEINLWMTGDSSLGALLGTGIFSYQ